MSTAAVAVNTVQSTGNAGSTGSAATNQVGWGDDWRQRLVAGSTDVDGEVKHLQRFESPQQIYKSMRELQSHVNTDYTPKLKKDATPEEVAKWRQQNGIPDKPEAYSINLPRGADGKPRANLKEDDPFLNAFLKSAHSQNYTQGQVDAAIGSFYSEVDRQVEATTEAEKKAEQATDEKLRGIWGTDYRPNKAMVEALLSRAPAGFRDRFMNGYLADHTPIKASPEAWQWLVQMEREINPFATVVPGSTGDPGKNLETELTDIKKHMANTGQPPYWKGPEAEKMQARYRELIAAQQRMAAKTGKAA